MAYLSVPARLLKMDVTNDSIMLKNIADQKPLTLNPETSQSANKIITALITNRKRPSVIMVAGNVKKIKTGFTKALKKARANATIIPTIKPSTLTPGSNH